MMPAALPASHVVAGRFRIVRALGSGGFGAVYEAVPLESSEPMALKIMHRHIGSSEPDLRRFEREASLAQQLVHPHIVHAAEFGFTEDGLPFIAFELLRGRSLREELDERGALSSADTAQIALQLLGALELAHSKNIIHRDIKPANIFLCDTSSHQPLAKVLDFGIAKAMHGDANATQLTATGQMLGSPAYMAPEQVRGDPIVPAVDLYSLGLVLAEMLSGRPVVQGASDIDTVMAHVKDGPHQLAGAVRSSPLGQVIERAIEKAAAKRFAKGADMRAAVQHAISEAAAALPTVPATFGSEAAAPIVGSPLPVAPLAASPLPQPAASAQRGSAGLVLIAVAALLVVGLVVVGGGAWLWLSNGRAPVASSRDGDANPGPKPRSGPHGARSVRSAKPIDATEWVSEALLRKRFEALGWRVVAENPTNRGPAVVNKFQQVEAEGVRVAINLYHYRSERLARHGAEIVRKTAGTACRQQGRVVIALTSVLAPAKAQSLLDRLLEGVPSAN